LLYDFAAVHADLVVGVFRAEAGGWPVDKLGEVKDEYGL
jgi:hypothetical protein